MIHQWTVQVPSSTNNSKLKLNNNDFCKNEIKAICPSKALLNITQIGIVGWERKTHNKVMFYIHKHCFFVKNQFGAMKFAMLSPNNNFFSSAIKTQLMLLREV